MKRRSFLQSAASGLGVPLAGVAWAQAWPARPIRFVIPFPPGGSSDVFVRTLAARLTEILGQPLVVDYRTGAAGTIGLDAVAKAAPDGYTLGLGSPGGLVAVPHMMKVPYNVERDFTYLTMLAKVPSVIVTSNTSGINSLRDLVDKARAAPGTMHFGHAGQGTLVHLAGELFKREAKLDITPAPFKGGVAAATAVIGNHVPVAVVDLSAVWPQISGGLLKPLAVTGAQRSPALPNVPTLAESGFPQAVFDAEYGVLAPAGLPPEVLARLSTALAAAMDSAALREAYLRVGASAAPSTEREYRDSVMDGYRKWGAFIREQKITAE